MTARRNAVEADAVYIVATIGPFIGLRGDGNAGFFRPHPGLTARLGRGNSWPHIVECLTPTSGGRPEGGEQCLCEARASSL